MNLPGLYAFDDADAGLSLLPMAARRALDVAGVHLSLHGWQHSSIEQRCELIRLGAAEQVDVARVRECTREFGPYVRPELPLVEPDVSAGPPPALVEALGPARPLDRVRWAGLRALDRYVLSQLAKRGKLDRLAEAYAEITSTARTA